MGTPFMLVPFGKNLYSVCITASSLVPRKLYGRHFLTKGALNSSKCCKLQCWAKPRSTRCRLGTSRTMRIFSWLLRANLFRIRFRAGSRDRTTSSTAESEQNSSRISVRRGRSDKKIRWIDFANPEKHTSVIGRTCPLYKTQHSAS